MAAPEDEAPELTLSGDEPPALPSSAAQSFVGEDSLRVLRRLAGAEVDPARARVALTRLMSGESVAAHELPDTRTLVVGLALAMVRAGTDPRVIVDAILDCFE
jgi:hypothetical protein